MSTPNSERMPGTQRKRFGSKALCLFYVPFVLPDRRALRTSASVVRSIRPESTKRGHCGAGPSDRANGLPLASLVSWRCPPETLGSGKGEEEGGQDHETTPLEAP